MKKAEVKPEITDVMKVIAEKQIKSQQSETKFDLRDFTIDYIVKQFQDDLFFIPEYQRKFIWPPKHQIDFIESIFLGLPIPMMFVADIDDGRLEIVDGAQRIQTLEAFKSNDLVLSGLKYLTALEGFKYSDLPEAQQKKFDTKALRMVVLEDSTTIERRQEIFNRINTGSIVAKPSEIRRGNFDSKFMKFIIECSTNKEFVKLCPVSEGMVKRREREELVLRFFAFSYEYKMFKHDVGKFLDAYLLKSESSFDKKQMKSDFEKMLSFVGQYFPAGFAKKKGQTQTPRVRFEAISVGVYLAQKTKKNLVPSTMDWLDSKEFKFHTTTHASNSQPKLAGRIEYVKNMLVNG